MPASEASFLDALAACLGAGVSLTDALSRIETAGAGASRWVQRIRPFVRPGASVQGSLHAAGAIDATEQTLLALAATPQAVERLLHTLALRRRRRATLRSAILGGLVGPVAIGALTVVLNPLPNLVGNGSYVGPVLRGLFLLGLATAFVVAGVPALLRSPSAGPRVLALCARLPGLAWFAARYAEGELVTISVPFVARSEVGSEGLLAASTMLAWSPLGERIRAATLASAPSSELALPRLAPHLSLGTNLAIVDGIASGLLEARLGARGEQIAGEVTSQLRLGVRVVAYALVVIFSIGSLLDMVSRGLPGMPLLPGAAPSEEQKELDEIMKEMNPPVHPAPSK